MKWSHPDEEQGLHLCAGVPRVFDRIYTGAMAKIEEKGGLAARLFKLGYGIKAAKLRRNIRYDKVCLSAEAKTFL